MTAALSERMLRPRATYHRVMGPSSDVLRAFGVREMPFRLEGGQGTTWRSEDVVLKPVDLPTHVLNWLDIDVRRHVTPSELRLSLPIRSRSGDFVVDGWTAFPALVGTHPVDRWLEVADVARKFSASLDGLDVPDLTTGRTDSWARADRFAWGEEELRDCSHSSLIRALVAARRPLDAAPHVVHGDLTGNVLFAPSLPPAVIDLTLYWRPVEYSVAVIAVDAVCCEGASLSLFKTISAATDFYQHLVRALLFRIATDVLRGGADERVYSDAVRAAL
jgi:uncharacterized protein (TIGR02569 family)